MWLCVCLKVSLWVECDFLYGAVWCVFLLCLCLRVVCLNVCVCLFVVKCLILYGMLFVLFCVFCFVCDCVVCV